MSKHSDYMTAIKDAGQRNKKGTFAGDKAPVSEGDLKKQLEHDDMIRRTHHPFSYSQ